MPKQIKTEVVLEHKTKGFDKARNENAKYNNTIHKLEKSLTALRSEYKSVSREVENLTKQLEKQARIVEQQQRKSAAKGAFAQGLAQGGMPGMQFIQRGPGMPSQMAGMAIGRGFRTAQAGFGGSFSGVQGMQQFLGSIPLVGGFLSGQVGKMAGYSEQALQYQRTRLQASPYISGFSDLRQSMKASSANTRRRKEIAALEAELAAEPKTITYQKSQAKIEDAIRVMGIKKAAIRSEIERPKLTGADAALDFITGGNLSRIRALQKESVKAEEKVYEVRMETYEKSKELSKEDIKNREASTKKLKELQSAPSAVGGTNPLRGLAGEGVNLLGMNKDETLQFLSTILEAGGGTAGGQAKGFRRSAFAAKTLFGVQGATSGAFLKAGRRGGVVGGMENATGVFEEAIYKGMLLGLSGSEMNNYLQQIAQGINQFQITGIPINPGSITNLATDIAGAGVSGTRALTMAQGVTSYIQGIGSKGVTSGADLLALRELGGYKGGGAEGYRAARSRLEKLQAGVQGKGAKELAGSPISKFLQSYLGKVGGSQGTKAEMLQRLLGRMGVQGSVEEFDWLASQLTGAGTMEGQGAGIKRFAAQQEQGLKEFKAIQEVGGLAGAAKGTVGYRAPALKRQVSMQNQQIAVGSKVVSTIQNLEQSALNTTKAFENLAGGPLLKLSNGMSNLAVKTMEVATHFVKMIESGADISKWL